VLALQAEITAGVEEGGLAWPFDAVVSTPMVETELSPGQVLALQAEVMADAEEGGLARSFDAVVSTPVDTELSPEPVPALHAQMMESAGEGEPARSSDAVVSTPVETEPSAEQILTPDQILALLAYIMEPTDKPVGNPDREMDNYKPETGNLGLSLECQEIAMAQPGQQGAETAVAKTQEQHGAEGAAATGPGEPVEDHQVVMAEPEPQQLAVVIQEVPVMEPTVAAVEWEPAVSEDVAERNDALAGDDGLSSTPLSPVSWITPSPVREYFAQNQAEADGAQEGQAEGTNDSDFDDDYFMSQLDRILDGVPNPEGSSEGSSESDYSNDEETPLAPEYWDFWNVDPVKQTADYLAVHPPQATQPTESYTAVAQVQPTGESLGAPKPLPPDDDPPSNAVADLPPDPTDPPKTITYESSDSEDAEPAPNHGAHPRKILPLRKSRISKDTGNSGLSTGEGPRRHILPLRKPRVTKDKGTDNSGSSGEGAAAQGGP
ncbi:hypothetical protein GP486_004780, partial [Trichoglossum hirsutum]